MASSLAPELRNCITQHTRTRHIRARQGYRTMAMETLCSFICVVLCMLSKKFGKRPKTTQIMSIIKYYFGFYDDAFSGVFIKTIIFKNN